MSKRPRTADRLHRVLVRLLRRIAREDEAMGISGARASALSLLEFGGPLPVGALARFDRVRPPTMTRLVTGMERDGLVVRGPDQGDGRVVRVRITPKGSRLIQEGRRRRVAALAQRLEGLSGAEMDLLRRAADVFEQLLSRW